MAKKRKKETLAEKVGRYKRMNETIGDDDGADSDDSDDLFSEITEDSDPALIPLLLRMRVYDKTYNYSDEMNEIVQFLRDFPPDVLLDGFIPCVGEMGRSGTLLFKDLMSKMLWSDETTELLITRLPLLDSDAIKGLKNVVKALDEEPQEPEMKANIDKLLLRLVERQAEPGAAADGGGM
jgi:hypothetical protein